MLRESSAVREQMRRVVSPHRKRVINLAVAFFLTGSAVSLIAQRDFWPFSHYPMFAALQPPELEVLELVGVASTNSEEISLAPSRRSSIVAGSRYRAAWNLLIQNGTEPEIRASLATAARRYEHTQSDTGTLRAVRLYKSRWRAVPNETPSSRRVSRQLLAEVNLDR
jgi:hypothetical protein